SHGTSGLTFQEGEPHAGTRNERSRRRGDGWTTVTAFRPYTGCGGNHAGLRAHLGGHAIHGERCVGRRARRLQYRRRGAQGPHEGMYEVRYYGMDGWVWAEYLDIGGATAAVGASGGGEVAAPAPAPEPERWIDVNRSTGAVSLMIGDSVQATYWASLGWDTS